jgi:two-component system, LytTR family, response regulator
MPGCSGLDVLSSLPEPQPRIVFCTAFDQYAVDAFELNAVDYLLKPVTRARLTQAIARLLQEAGFQSVQIAGGFDGNPFEHDTDELVIEATVGSA